eukprot:g45917.t1
MLGISPHVRHMLLELLQLLLTVAKNIIKLERVQKRFTRMLLGLEGLSYKERLEHFSPERRRLMDDLIEVSKIMRGKDKVNSKGLFPRLSHSNGFSRGRYAQHELVAVVQIHGGGCRGEFGPSKRCCGISSGCICEVGRKQTHSNSAVNFGLVQYLVASVAFALVKSMRAHSHEGNIKGQMAPKSGNFSSNGPAGVLLLEDTPFKYANQVALELQSLDQEYWTLLRKLGDSEFVH